MSSSPDWYAPLSSGGQHDGAHRKRSQFTYRHLSQMASYVTSSPLRVIAHVDLDAFYAQCEMVRLGLPDDQPLAVQQWQSLIAINYPARKSGIGGRLGSVLDAKKVCPDLIAQHVATWREGDDKWAYRADAAANMTTDKVSLDPYRLESRRILALVRAHLPQNLQRVEKASVDEVFLDLSAQVHSILLERFTELQQPPPYNDPTERLPLPSVSALDWQADALVDLDEEREGEDPDWDDVAILVGSEIVRGLRTEIRERLRYTCSAGVACNKLLSKLGSGYKKPNHQTVVRNRAVGIFLHEFKLTKIRNLGGKLGEQVVSLFGTEQVKDLLPVPIEQLKAKLGEETGIWLYNTIRGVDTSEVNPRTQIKSMLSAKSFRPHIDTPEQAIKWLRIFVGDIFNRLVEEGVLENKRRPKTIHLSARHMAQTRSRQIPIPQGRPIDETMLIGLAKDLLSQILGDRSIWPCNNLSLTVGGFEDGIKNNMGIGAFLVKGDAAMSLKADDHGNSASASSERPHKRARADEAGIQRFFVLDHTERTPGAEADATTAHVRGRDGDCVENNHGHHKSDADAAAEAEAEAGIHIHQPGEPQRAGWWCGRCNASFDMPEALQSHMDWHMAKDIQEEERVTSTFAEGSRSAKPVRGTSNKGPGGSSTSRRGGRGGGSSRLEQGQSKLKFG
ncbi:sister chromatid cohesion protein Eso1 [Cordyceps fumosorosea ARSEF 2679]|uniref:DNA polymerase eta n=1 Tax=Cordyceps fumosorosea (strain ARSEF 2679) TaxID=1081104 RepID=A0A167T077_CORFA|nr:sister chromatid cohesion protein Eso1 [Cordyceps fumosorosea ARSEF 2679]OAA60113.1 sister chromatid cohesion protein Eso1 [Cordyceps fumosorosea ARSEF 2679]